MENVYNLPNYDFQTNIWLVHAHTNNQDWRNKTTTSDYYKLKNRIKKKLGILRCGIIMIDKQDRILCVKGKKSGKWSLPKGHQRHPFEKPHVCAMRELHEETNIILPILEINRLISISDQRYFIAMVDDLDQYQYFINDRDEVREIKAIHKNELMTYDINYGLRQIIYKI